MKKIFILSLIALLTFFVLTGCTNNQSTNNPPRNNQPTKNRTTENQKQTKQDVVTTASIVNDNEAFKKAISKDGTWIVAILRDLKFDNELVVEGQFRNKGKAENELYRKLAFYAQDEDRNVTARYTVTAPKMTIKSPNTKIQGGTFVGDVYVEAKGFTIQDAKVDGDVYFANEDYKSSFDKSNNGEVTGDVKVQK